MFEKVLLPIDLTHTESWENALPAALKCAGDRGELHLLAIVQEVGSPMVESFLPEGYEKAAIEKTEHALRDFANTHCAGQSVSVHVGHGQIAETVIATAEKIGAQLIVMASHPPNELRSILIGSHAGRVVRHSPISVLVAR
ncbi:MAG: universal stress protein [Pseudomonadota bacterium]|nr:universal stress protein [Pseudomonadota bacterium]